jgi:diadenosine tetraphosphate (Ap4A) HIT family hydrolase
MKYLWLLSVLLAFVDFLGASTWTLNRNVLEERLPPGVTTEELIRVLQNEDIEVHFETQPDLTLWKGKWTSISLSPSPFAPYHLWIAIDGRHTLHECTTDELAELYAAIWKARKAVSDTTGADGFMIFTTEEVRNGKGSASVGVEIVPSGFGGSQGIMDAVEKNALNDYVFYNQFSIRRVSQSPKTIAAIREKLQTIEPSIQIEQIQQHCSQKLLHHKEALHQNLQSIYDILAQMGALIEGEMPPMPLTEEHVHEIQIDLHKCAFCNPKVIEKQIVCDWKQVYVLMSHKPVSPYGNFLILPKRHQCAWDLTKEEAIASFEAIIALKKMFLETMGSNHWICYIQDGPTVGQTVPHTHIHFYILPDPLKSAIAGLQHIHNQRPILTYEEMRASCEKTKPLLFLQLEKRKQF